MSDLLPCPNGGKCGSKRHRAGSNSWNQCLKNRQRALSKSSSVLGVPPSPSTVTTPSPTKKDKRAERRIQKKIIRSRRKFANKTPEQEKRALFKSTHKYFGDERMNDQKAVMAMLRHLEKENEILDNGGNYYEFISRKDEPSQQTFVFEMNRKPFQVDIRYTEYKRGYYQWQRSWDVNRIEIDE